MAAPRKNPPKDAATTIEQLAAKGYSIIGIAKNLGVSRETFKKWCDEDGTLQEAFEIGRETERQALHALIVQSAAMNKPANVNAFFILKARHGYRESDPSNTKVDVSVSAPQNVLVIRDHGTDAQWAAKAAEQQRNLIADNDHKPQLEAPQGAQVDAQPYFGPPVIHAPVYAPQVVPVAAVVPPAPKYDAPVWRAKA